MSSDSSSNVIDPTAAMNEMLKEQQLQYGPNVKIEFIPNYPIDRVQTPIGFNMRNEPGMVLGGVTVTKDTRNIGGMAADIEKLGGIAEPLTVFGRDDLKDVLGKGYRRYGGAQMIRREKPGTPLAEKLATIPVFRVTGLTADQERAAVNDQTSKGFTSSEVFRFFKHELDGGFGWENICARIYQQIGVVTGSAENVAKIDSITDAEERRKELKKWLTPYAYQWWFQACKNGAQCLNLTMQTLLWNDGNISQRPRVVMDSMRMRAIYTEIIKDKEASEFNPITGEGPRMQKVIDKYAAMDEKAYDADGNKIPKKKNDGPSFRKFDEVLKIVGDEETAQPGSLLAAVLRVTFKNGGNPDAFAQVRNYDRCRSVFQTHRDFLKPELREIMDLVFSGTPGSEQAFTGVMVSNHLPTQGDTNDVTVPTPELPVTSEELTATNPISETVTQPEPIVNPPVVENAGDTFPLTEAEPATSEAVSEEIPSTEETAARGGKGQRRKHAKK